MHKSDETERHENKLDQNYDLIVIGSGLGGLVTASLMAKLKKWRVLVLERHYVAGGFTHTFRRPGGYEWDVGVHYVGLMGSKHQERKLFDFVTDGNLDWVRIAEPVDVFDYPDLRIPQYSDERIMRHKLIELFPGEASAIHKYYKDLKIAERWGVINFFAGTLPNMLAKLIRYAFHKSGELALQTTEEYLNRHFSHPKLKAIICSQWMAFGLPPSESAFGMHAAVVRHYFKGGYFPKGGAGQIAKSIIKVIRDHGGDVRINHEVTQILLSDGAAIGVEVKIGNKKSEALQSIYAPAIVSDTGVHTTFTKLIKPEVTKKYQASITKMCKIAPSSVSLYLGLKSSPEELGFRGENHWIYDGFDHEHHARSIDFKNSKVTAGHLSFPSLKDNHGQKHTAEFFSLVDFDQFQAWQSEKWKKRGKDYDSLKYDLTKSMLSLIDTKYPGFSDLVDYAELSTPLTVKHFMNHPQGIIYGLPGTPYKFQQKWLKAKSPVPNLYLTGVDILCVGIVPALLSGAATAGALIGPFGFLKVMYSSTK